MNEFTSLEIISLACHAQGRQASLGVHKCWSVNKEVVGGAGRKRRKRRRFYF